MDEMIALAMTFMFVIGVLSAATTAFAGDAIILLRDPRAVDGDTLAVDRSESGVGVYVRLWGISAPEMDEPGGSDAREALARLVQGATLVCIPRERPSYGRVVAVCHRTDDMSDLGALMVRSGNARDCQRYSGGAYQRFETDASRRLPLPGWCER